jgi:hypothetical protein
MVDVGAKRVTKREAVARGRLRMRPATLQKTARADTDVRPNDTAHDDDASRCNKCWA